MSTRLHNMICNYLGGGRAHKGTSAWGHRVGAGPPSELTSLCRRPGTRRPAEHGRLPPAGFPFPGIMAPEESVLGQFQYKHWDAFKNRTFKEKLLSHGF